MRNHDHHHQTPIRVLEFRTPQHPSLGTNNWGGASPLLARNVPQESLEQKYHRLTSTRTGDDIFAAHYDLDDVDDGGDNSFSKYTPRSFASKVAREYKYRPKPFRRLRRGFLWKLVTMPWRDRTANINLGSNANEKKEKKEKKGCFPRWDPKNRWPNGWC